MTDEELSAIEERAKAATPGPWASTWDPVKGVSMDPTQIDEAAIVSTAEGRTGDDAVVVGTFWYDGPHPVCNGPDAAFIACARTDVPALVAEVRRLRAEVERLQRRPPNEQLVVPLMDAVCETFAARMRERYPDCFVGYDDDVLHLYTGTPGLGRPIPENFMGYHVRVHFGARPMPAAQEGGR